MKSPLRQRLISQLMMVGFFLADHSPWFIRKRVVNAIARNEIYSDFHLTDQLLAGHFGLLAGWSIPVRD